MSLIQHNIQKLADIKALLEKLPDELYVRKKEVLSGSTIGQHFRHILEFYVCLKKGSDTGIVCYDARERNTQIETDRLYASGVIEDIKHFLYTLSPNCNVMLMANYSVNNDEQTEITSSLYRELAYALDHTVHHLAIVKIALSEEKESVLLDENLGVAPSTIRYREQQCAQ